MTSTFSISEEKLSATSSLGFSEPWWTNYRSLVEKRNEGIIVPDELQELVALTDTIEEANVRRMANLASQQ